jgi:iron complex transport system substrate-binding protein
MKFKRIFLIAIMAALLQACAPAVTSTPIASNTDLEPAATEPTAVPTPEKLTFTDDLGNTIELTEYPKSIVSISPSMTEILFAIGAGDQVVGRDDASTYPEEALGATSIGSLWGELPTEAILALEPDLVLAAQIISEDQVSALRELGLNVYWQENPTNYEELYENIRDITEITGHEKETETLIADLDTRVKAVQEKIAPISARPMVFYELDATDPSNPWTAGAGTFIDYIISMAGGSNIAQSVSGDYVQISTEEILSSNPQVILLADALYGTTPESVAARPGWDAIIAVQNGAVYPIDPNIMSVPGPRLVDALEETAKLLHPGLFE